jgi:aspartyl/asparaginyl-tRNA synthetase
MKQTVTYHEITQKLRDFFLSKGYIEVPSQSRKSILAACENPHSVATFEYDGLVWPLPQTGQMWLEYELLKNPHWKGCFCVSTSYRNEKEPIPGRHEKIFPMFEFESKGDFDELRKLNVELVEYLGFNTPKQLDYNTTSERYAAPILEDEHEARMWQEVGHSISLETFPIRTSPFWNMRYIGDGKFNKCDIILYGQETFGTAERSCNPEEMRNFFYTIMDGTYCEKLFELFGKERVEAELEEFLSYKFFPRFGGGIGLTRLGRAWEMLAKEKEKVG